MWYEILAGAPTSDLGYCPDISAREGGEGGVSAISSLFARMLALMDDVLTYFVLYSAPSSNADFCNPLIEATQGNAWVTPCGESFLQNVFELWQLVNELVHPFQTGMAVVAGFLGVS